MVRPISGWPRRTRLQQVLDRDVLARAQERVEDHLALSAALEAVAGDVAREYLALLAADSGCHGRLEPSLRGEALSTKRGQGAPAEPDEAGRGLGEPGREARVPVRRLRQHERAPQQLAAATGQQLPAHAADVGRGRLHERERVAQPRGEPAAQAARQRSRRGKRAAAAGAARRRRPRPPAARPRAASRPSRRRRARAAGPTLDRARARGRAGSRATGRASARARAGRPRAARAAAAGPRPRAGPRAGPRPGRRRDQTPSGSSGKSPGAEVTLRCSSSTSPDRCSTSTRGVVRAGRFREAGPEQRPGGVLPSLEGEEVDVRHRPLGLDLVDRLGQDDALQRQRADAGARPAPTPRGRPARAAAANGRGGRGAAPGAPGAGPRPRAAGCARARRAAAPSSRCRRASARSPGRRALRRRPRPGRRPPAAAATSGPLTRPSDERRVGCAGCQRGRVSAYAPARRWVCARVGGGRPPGRSWRPWPCCRCTATPGPRASCPTPSGPAWCCAASTCCRTRLA